MSQPPAGPDLDRRRAYRLGLGAETLAAWALRLKGWRILARRFKAGPGEIDLVARKGNIVAFVEVKARRSRDAALEAITPASRRRIVRAAKVFVARHPKAVFHTLRFDVVLVVPGRWPEHIEDAFPDTD
ncbi:YraN family protein [Polymorphum gilvum]|uniref:UPF0102 protein SL003B_0037 n=1 Tax=Polymorphum gilvum (strain LMG 25793 / CGMCC 1.9160 / SL003B-26A1) TaxID=991905 RepID=F2IYG3_POLGS|nr:YraN family protein [Polymorphum gilvum]ADZ68476.1 Predicted endonuclease [Polymorphum gilvum SL003B-26A1]